jgi:adenylate kinase family enzyme
LLRQSLNWPHVSTGDMLREHVQAADAIGQENTLNKQTWQ